MSYERGKEPPLCVACCKERGEGKGETLITERCKRAKGRRKERTPEHLPPSFSSSSPFFLLAAAAARHAPIYSAEKGGGGKREGRETTGFLFPTVLPPSSLIMRSRLASSSFFSFRLRLSHATRLLLRTGRRSRHSRVPFTTFSPSILCVSSPSIHWQQKRDRERKESTIIASEKTQPTGLD